MFMFMLQGNINIDINKGFNRLEEFDHIRLKRVRYIKYDRNRAKQPAHCQRNISSDEDGRIVGTKERVRNVLLTIKA